MGAEIAQGRDLTEEERAAAQRKLQKLYEQNQEEFHTIGHAVDPTNRRFGIETEQHIVTQNNGPAPGSTAYAIERGAPAVPEAVDFQVELVSSPHHQSRGVAGLLSEMEQKEDILRRTIPTGSRLLPMGVHPSFSDPHSLYLFNSQRVRSQTIGNYVLRNMKEGDLRIELADGGIENLGIVSAAGLINELHVSLEATDSQDAALVMGIMSAYAPVLAAIGANSRFINNRESAYAESQIPIYESNREIRQGIPRVGMYPKYLGDISSYFKDTLAFRPIFKPDETDPIGSLQGHFSTVWPWVRPSKNGSYRIELRSISKQPSVTEDVALGALTVYTILGEIENASKSGLEVQHYLESKFPAAQDNGSNLHAVARHGLQAKVRWNGGEIVRVNDLAHKVFSQAQQYMSTNGIEPVTKELVETLRERMVRAGSPSDVMRKQARNHGIRNTLETYMNFAERNTGQFYGL